MSKKLALFFYLQMNGIERFELMGETIGDFFALQFGLKCTEQAIPNYKHATIVLVNTVAIAAVVHAMMARRVQHVLERAERVDRLGVYPKLIQYVHVTVNDEYGGSHEKSQRQIESNLINLGEKETLAFHMCRLEKEREREYRRITQLV